MSEQPPLDFMQYDPAEALQVFRVAVQKVVEMRAAQRQESGDVSDLMRWAEWRIDTLQTALERSAGERVPVDEVAPPMFTPVWTSLGVRVWDGAYWIDAFAPTAPIVRSRWEMQHLERRRRARAGPTWWLRERC